MAMFTVEHGVAPALKLGAIEHHERAPVRTVTGRLAYGEAFSAAGAESCAGIPASFAPRRDTA